MLTSDDFVITVPRQGLPFIAEPGGDLSQYVDGHHFRVNRTVALRSGRSLTGSVFRARELSASDEIHIQDLLNQRFAK
jgi:hypothetical protein